MWELKTTLTQYCKTYRQNVFEYLHTPSDKNKEFVAASKKSYRDENRKIVAASNKFHHDENQKSIANYYDD